MRLNRARPSRPQIPATPLANLALLVLTCVMIAGMYSASRGPGLRFASVDRDGGFVDEGAVRVEVLSEDEAQVDGVATPCSRLAEEVGHRLLGRAHPSIILVVSPDATYQAMVAAYSAMAGLPGPPRIAFPAREKEPQG